MSIQLSNTQGIAEQPRKAQEKNESFSQKLVLIVIDKFILALFFVVVGYLFSIEQDRRSKTIEYQSKLFERRQEAYISLLAAALSAQDECGYVYGKYETESNVSLRVDLDSLSEMWRELVRRNNPNGMGSGGSASRSGTSIDVVAALKKVDSVRFKNVLYISESINAEVDTFIISVSRDVRYEMNAHLRDESLTKDWDKHASQRASRAFHRLFLAIRKSLDVDEMILG